MRPWMDRATLGGRLHGRLLLVLVAVAVLTSVAAIWQFSMLREDHDPDWGQIDDRGALTDADVIGGSGTATASVSATPSPTVSASASETASGTATASEPAAPTEAAVSGPQCTASLRLDNEWDDSVSVTVTVTNTGTDPIEGWEVLLEIKHLTVTTTFGLEHIEGDRYGDILLNAALDAGESVDAGFQADVNGNFELPATVPCTPAA
ncbi:cellulose binding domain-containing protein [Glycomyces rhizosphaerae]|uniref:Cellulose binding domain-containing protein n=1 Tax=Glycomyces rhizosphaerae TaxID=2054422 RepID=A0ABV7PSK3_9ACTN